MDTQTIAFWQLIITAITAGLTALTLGVLTWYTIETYRLRKAAQKQTELQLRPFVILEVIKEEAKRGFQLRNVGNGTATDIRVEDVLVEPYPARTGIIRFPTPIPALKAGEKVPLRYTTSFDDKMEWAGIEKDPNEFAQVLLPYFADLVTNLNPLSGPEIKVQFKNVDGTLYFVKERLSRGHLEICSSSKY